MGRYYRVKGSTKNGNQTRVLLRFDMPEMNHWKRRRILEAVMEEWGADALVEFFWTKGSLIHKNMRSFDAILIQTKRTIGVKKLNEFV